jgi:hypothetical protein
LIPVEINNSACFDAIPAEVIVQEIPLEINTSACFDLNIIPADKDIKGFVLEA